MKMLNIGLIGFGYIGKIHAVAYRDIPLCLSSPKVAANLQAVLRSQMDTEIEAMHGAGFQFATTDPEAFYAQPLDLVDICTPNFLHLEQCRQALSAGLPVYCEKPLANNLEEAQTLVQLAEQANLPTQVAFVMRYLPAVRQMKALIQAGEIGEILNFRGHMFHGSYLDPSRPMSWRLRRAESGGGVFADLGAHLVDMALYLLGDPVGVRAETRTFIQQRATTRGSRQMESVDVDDWALCTLELSNGAIGVIEVTRTAAGASEDSGFQVFGSKGALSYSEKYPNNVRLYTLKRGEWIDGPADILAIPGERPISELWPSGKYSQGLMTNAHLAAEYDFLLNVIENKSCQADFRAAASVQAVIDAVYISAARLGELYKLR